MRLFILAGLFLAVLLPMQVLGESTDAGKLDDLDFELQNTQDLVDICSTPLDHPLYLRAVDFCLGFVSGVMHFHREAVVQLPDFKPLACPQKEIPRYEFVFVFLDWAERNPQFMNTTPVEGLVRAAEEKWPCR